MMNNEIVKRIEEEIGTLLDKLKDMDPNSKEYTDIVTTINKLYETVNKEKEIGLRGDSLAMEASENYENRVIKTKERRAGALINGLKTGVELAAVVVPVVFYGLWMQQGFEFEKEGSITTTTFRGLIGKFKTTK